MNLILQLVLIYGAYLLLVAAHEGGHALAIRRIALDGKPRDYGAPAQRAPGAASLRSEFYRRGTRRRRVAPYSRTISVLAASSHDFRQEEKY